MANGEGRRVGVVHGRGDAWVRGVLCAGVLWGGSAGEPARVTVLEDGRRGDSQRASAVHELGGSMGLRGTRLGDGPMGMAGA